MYLYIYIHPRILRTSQVQQMLTFTNLTPRYVRAHLVGHCEGRCQHRTFDSSRSFDRRESRVLWGSSPIFLMVGKGCFENWDFYEVEEILCKCWKTLRTLQRFIHLLVLFFVCNLNIFIRNCLVIADGHHHFHCFLQICRSEETWVKALCTSW